MELIGAAIVVLFLIFLVILVMFEVEFAWAMGIAAAATLVLCAIAAVRFVPWFAPSPMDVVRTMSFSHLAALLIVLTVAVYGIWRFMTARRSKIEKSGPLH